MKCIGDVGKTCGGKLLPRDPIDITSEWLCNRCEVSISNEQIEIILTNIEQEVDYLLMPSVSRINQALIEPKDYEALIQKLSHLLHENHFHLFALKHSLIQMYGHKPNYKLHELSDDLLQKKLTMCEQLLNILDHIDPYTMRLTLYTSIVLHELHFVILEQDNRQVAKSFKSNINAHILAQRYLDRGIGALSLNQDIEQGRKLMASFKRAEISLHLAIEALRQTS